MLRISWRGAYSEEEEKRQEMERKEEEVVSYSALDVAQYYGNARAVREIIKYLTHKRFSSFLTSSSSFLSFISYFFLHPFLPRLLPFVPSPIVSSTIFIFSPLPSPLIPSPPLSFPLLPSPPLFLIFLTAQHRFGSCAEK